MSWTDLLWIGMFVDWHGRALLQSRILAPCPTAPAPPRMDRKLLDLLVCPLTRQPLALLDSRGLQALNDAIQAGAVVRGDGSAQSDAVREALVTRDHRTVYRIDDGIPVLLAEDAIATAQLPAFPSA